MKDEILTELWQVKDQIAAETKGNTKALFERLRKVRLSPTQKRIDRSRLPQRQHV